jgi:hypothetical protein
MPSSKSSKRGSKLNTKLSSSKFSINNPKQKQSTTVKFATFLFSIIFNGIILYYLYNLEDVSCQCIRDWRHNFIKFMCSISIMLSFLPLFGLDTMKLFPKILGIIALLGFVNLYAIYTYVGDLNTTKCSCAVEKQPTINWIMEAYRYYIVAVIYFLLFLIIVVPIVLYLFLKSQK